nr:hypothetical protein [Gemmatimonadaceae bacterium]
NYGDFVKTFNDREARGGPAFRKSSNVDAWGGVETDSRKSYTANLFAGRWKGDDGNSKSWWIGPGMNFRIASQFSESLGLNYSKDINDKQWRANFGVAGNDTTHYTFARLDQKTVSLTSRINYTATPNLSLQIYAQPFVSTGDYTNWRELADPRASDYAARFKPYAGDPGSFSFKQFRSNTVLRWEYMPGSTMFVVWAQGRQLDGLAGSEFNFRRDMGDVFDTHPDNTFLVKFSYWFNP